MTIESEPRQTLASVERALDVVEGLWDLEGAGVTELADELGLAKSTVHSHLSTLHHKGYVVKDGDEYRLSLRFLTFGEHAKLSEDLYDIAQPEVEKLAEETGQQVICAVEQNGLGAILAMSCGRDAFQTNLSVGSQLYLHCSACGKAMLAHMPAERVEWIIDRWGMKSATSHTLTDREQLLDELAEVRERGVAFNREEFFLGVNAIGAPILDDGTVIGALAIVGPKHRLGDSHVEENLVKQLLQSLNVIEVNMKFA